MSRYVTMQFIRAPGAVAQYVEKIERKIYKPKTTKAVKARKVDVEKSNTTVVPQKREKRLRRYNKERKIVMRSFGVYIFDKQKTE